MELEYEVINTYADIYGDIHLYILRYICIFVSGHPYLLTAMHYINWQNRISPKSNDRCP